MSTVTLRFPDDKHARLKCLAAARQISLNKLLNELATIALANFGARTNFELSAMRSNVPHAIKLLDKSDRAEKHG